MALAGRSIRRGSAGFRWLAIAVAVTVLVLLIDAALKSRSSQPAQSLAAGSWIDHVLPVISSSTAEAPTVTSIWTGGLKTPPHDLALQVDQVAAQASSNYQAVAKLRPPQQLSGPAGLLEAALLARSEAAAALRQAILSTLGASALVQVPHASASPVTLISKAGQDIQVGDQAYQLFLSTFPSSTGVTMPPSAWAPDMTPYQPSSAQVFLSSLQSAAVTTPVHRVQIYSAVPSPGPVARSGSTLIIPDAQAITLTIVVANTGNQVEDNLTVIASISPVGSGTSTVRDFVNLQPGQAYTIAGLGPLNPPKGVPVTLTITLSGPTGSVTPPATSTETFQMPAPPASTTTSAPSASTTTSVPSSPVTT